jgi:hypothetical protein
VVLLKIHAIDWKETLDHKLLTIFVLIWHDRADMKKPKSSIFSTNFIDDLDFKRSDDDDDGVSSIFVVGNLLCSAHSF